MTDKINQIIRLLTEIRDELPVEVKAEPETAGRWDRRGLVEYYRYQSGVEAGAIVYTFDVCGNAFYYPKGGLPRRALSKNCSTAEAIRAIYDHADEWGISVSDHPSHPRKKPLSLIERLADIAEKNGTYPVYGGYRVRDQIVATYCFYDVEVKTDGMLHMPAGHGTTFEEAATNYLGKIAGKVLVVHAGRPNSRTFTVSKETP